MFLVTKQQSKFWKFNYESCADTFFSESDSHALKQITVNCIDLKYIIKSAHSSFLKLFLNVSYENYLINKQLINLYFFTFSNK